MARRKRIGKKKLQRKLQNAGIMIILVLLGLVMLWPYLRTGLLTAFIPIGRGIAGALDDRASGLAVFAGGQTLMSAPGSGTITFLVEDGDLVRAGDVIAEIGEEGALASVKDGLIDAQAKLRQHEAESEPQFLSLTQTIQERYSKTADSFFEMQIAYESGDQVLLFESEEEFFARTNSLASCRQDLKALEDERAQLVRQYEMLQRIVATSSIKILAPVSGTFSCRLIPQDEGLDPLALAEKDASGLTVFAKNMIAANSLNVESGQSVKKGDIIGRIVTGNDTKYFLTVKTEDRPDIKVGDIAFVEPATGGRFQSSIVSVVDGRPPGYSIISGSIEYIPYDEYVRAAQTAIITRKKQGIIVPVKSLIDKQGQTGVLSVQKTYARFLPVEILMIKGDEAVVSGINETTDIVFKAKVFFEGRRVR